MSGVVIHPRSRNNSIRTHLVSFGIRHSQWRQPLRSRVLMRKLASDGLFMRRPSRGRQSSVRQSIISCSLSTLAKVTTPL